jgi:phosphoserine aminotransferase
MTEETTMSRIYNFSAGPCTLPLPALEQARDELVDYHGTGMSIIEMSHRSKPYDEVHSATLSLLRELLDVPDTHEILLLGGGATLQFSMVPLNLLHPGMSCDFTVSGSWAKKAHVDAKKVGSVRVLFDGKDANYTRLPEPGALDVDPRAAYLHITSNETIGGVQWKEWPQTGDVPLVCDMSSDFLSRRVPIGQFGVIYAGAQKNAGPAGVAVVIISKQVLERCRDGLTAYLSYPIHAEKNSLYNTPPVFAVYMMRLVLEWLKGLGGLDAAARMADERSSLLYDTIDGHSGFYSCPVERRYRSRMNVVFRLPSEELEKQFIAEADERGMSGLKGHRSVGGCRASIYNAMPVEGAQALADFMVEFARRHG